MIVRARLDINQINEIDDGAENFEFSGVMTLIWRDPRQAFDPDVEGVAEKIYTGTFQFDEVSPGWYPQVVLVNEAGLYEKSAVMLRVRPDGTSILTETLNAIAESKLVMRRFPFDRQHLEAAFQVLGFDKDEVQLVADAEPPPAAATNTKHTRDPEISHTGKGKPGHPSWAMTLRRAWGLVAITAGPATTLRLLQGLTVTPEDGIMGMLTLVGSPAGEGGQEVHALCRWPSWPSVI